MNKKTKIQQALETIIFSCRYLLIPFYLGLFITMLVYTYVFTVQIYHLVIESGIMTKDAVLLSTLELVDIVMIANLVKMIITGSCNSFVDKTHGYHGENISSGMLKVKMSTSLIGVSSIHLLQTFINSANVDWPSLQKQLLIHGTFLVGALILAIIDYLHVKSESLVGKEERNNGHQPPPNREHH